jgi:uncharacterized protein YaaN involved in tellurite resistance
MATTLEAPAITLTPPDPVPVVAPAQAAGLVPLAAEQKDKLDEKVDSFVADLIAQDTNSPEFGKRVDQLTSMGRKEIAAAAGMSNRFLDRPVRAMDKDQGVGANLIELRRTVEASTRQRRANCRRARSCSASFPSAIRCRNISTAMCRAGPHQGDPRQAGQRQGRAVDGQCRHRCRARKLWEAMGNLEQMIHISKKLDEKIEEKAGDLDATDPAKAKALRESALFYTRQRTQDLLTQMAVTVQGYLALDLVKKNNVELVKGVDRASTTTVAALRTAVTVAQAMTNQRLVLQQITALNETTAGIIDSTSTLLKEQTGQIHQQAAASTIPVEVLQRAFQNIYDTMDTIDTFKIKALDSMKQTVNTLSAEVEKSKGYIARAQGQSSAQVAHDGPSLLSLEG